MEQLRIEQREWLISRDNKAKETTQKYKGATMEQLEYVMFENNANFFHVNDIASISDDELYNRLLDEFPSWLKEVRRNDILR